MGQANWVVLGVLLVGVSACGGEEAGKPSGSAGSAGVATGGGGSGGSGGGAGSPTGGSAMGGAAIGSGSCTAPFGTATPVLVEDQVVSVNGISLTGDELELFYARNDASSLDAPVIVRRTRASTSAMFGPIEQLTMLDGVCADQVRVNPDISEDGLTLYVTCTTRAEDSSLPEGPSTLRVARRPDRASPFVLAAEPIGQVYASAGLSADELTAYTDGEIFETVPQMFVRMSEHENFTGAAQTIPGIGTPLRSPDVSASGLQLFGASGSPVDGTSGIYRFNRSSLEMPFGPPELLALGIPGDRPAIGAPNITPSCGLYLVAIARDIPPTIYRAAPQ